MIIRKRGNEIEGQVNEIEGQVRNRGTGALFQIRRNSAPVPLFSAIMTK